MWPRFFSWGWRVKVPFSRFTVGKQAALLVLLFVCSVPLAQAVLWPWVLASAFVHLVGGYLLFQDTPTTLGNDSEQFGGNAISILLQPLPQSVKDAYAMDGQYPGDYYRHASNSKYFTALPTLPDQSTQFPTQNDLIQNYTSFASTLPNVTGLTSFQVGYTFCTSSEPCALKDYYVDTSSLCGTSKLCINGYLYKYDGSRATTSFHSAYIVTYGKYTKPCPMGSTYNSTTQKCVFTKTNPVPGAQEFTFEGDGFYTDPRDTDAPKTTEANQTQIKYVKNHGDIVVTGYVQRVDSVTVDVYNIQQNVPVIHADKSTTTAVVTDSCRVGNDGSVSICNHSQINADGRAPAASDIVGGVTNGSVTSGGACGGTDQPPCLTKIDGSDVPEPVAKGYLSESAGGEGENDPYNDAIQDITDSAKGQGAFKDIAPSVSDFLPWIPKAQPCTQPLHLDVVGRGFDVDVCEKLRPLREILGYFLSLFTLYSIFNLALKPVYGGE
jgi:hypothetical protein